MKFHEFKISGKNLTPAKAKPFETITPWAAKLWPLPILLLATLVRLYGSTASAIWCDEGSSLLMSQYSPSLIWIHSAHDVHPPLYFLLLHIWIGAFGDSLFSIRFLSVLTGIGTVGLGMWLVYQVATRHAAIVAGVLMALLPIAVRYSQEVRMYSLMGLWLLGATLALVYWVRKPERHRYLVIYVLLMTASFYTHYFTGLCALSHWAYLTVVRSEKRRLVTLPAWWVANSFIAMLYAPWIPGLIDLLQHLDQLRAGGDIGWIEPITMASLPSTLWQYLTLSDAQNLRWPLYLALPLALVLVTGAVCLRDRSPYKFNVLLAIYAFLPLIVVFVVSWKVPLLVERYLMFSALGLPMILAIAIDQLRRHFRYAAVAMLVTVLTVELVGLHNDYQTDDEQFDKLVNYVNENYQANDRIVVSDLFWYFSYVYYNKTGSVPLLYTPPRADGTSGRPGDYGFGTLVNSDADRVYLDSLEMLPLGQTRVWLVSNSAPPDDFASIPGNWNKVSTLKVGDTQVRLYTLRRQ
ncbi:glycosyltransferase family 39 protein [Pseudomonas sp. NPDC089428]|uniref:glycosyltransferase family 39 protein n=1 Tax=Pseudomonas sp. NPDC089428 TaxID=3364467 RepID=UPI00382E7632